jgi:hypothetical protein
MKRTALALTNLYPASWRRRYGDEFQALLEQCPPRPRMLLNTAAGAAGAWLRWPAIAGPVSARLRGALTAVLWGGLTVLFVAAGFVKSEIPATHPAVNAVGHALVAVSYAAALLMAAGAVGPAVAVARRARQQHRADVLRLIAAPPVAGFVFLAVAAALGIGLRHAHLTPALGHTLFYFIAALFLAATIITGRASSLALRRLNPGSFVLLASVPFGVLTVAALTTATGLMATYTVLLDKYEPWLAHRDYGPPWRHDMLLAQLIVMTVVMGLGTLLAATGLAQGTLYRRKALT